MEFQWNSNGISKDFHWIPIGYGTGDRTGIREKGSDPMTRKKLRTVAKTAFRIKSRRIGELATSVRGTRCLGGGKEKKINKSFFVFVFLFLFFFAPPSPYKILLQ